MESPWAELGRRIVSGLDVRPGELVLVRDHAGNAELLHETLLAIELAGATPLPDLLPAAYIERLLAGADPAHLAAHDHHRAVWLRQADRIAVLGGAAPDFAAAPAAALDAFQAADERLTEIEEARRLPFLVAAIPTPARARQLGVSSAELEAHMLPALLVPPAEIRAEIERMLAASAGADTLTIRTEGGHELRMARAGRPWLFDDGMIDEADRARGAIVSNLPAASIYTTVLEDSAEGSIYLERTGRARGAVLHFRAGRVAAIEAAEGADALAAFLDGFSGEPRRISHIGLGLNPRLRRPIGWTIVDEHVYGALFLALGENRYMGGENISALNIDYALAGATLLAGERALVERGEVVTGGA
jgi:leucyl aminopeptidase (aminopeptidase T)